MRRAIVVALGLVLASMTAGPAGAVETHDVQVGSNFFEPALVRAVAGDQIRWTVIGGGHDVVAYSGASFNSGIMNSSSPPFVQTFNGGEVRYRCTPHSSITPSGTCQGMCGVIQDVPPPPVDTVRPTARVATESLAPFLGTVTITGTASDNVAVASVRVYFTSVRVPFTDVLSSSIPVMTATCANCPSMNVSWTLVKQLPPGIYSVHAVAIDTAVPTANSSVQSNTISIVVGPGV